MEVYLMRHAQPVRPTEWHGSDSTRPLTDQGKADLEMASEAMAKAGFELGLILSSPFKRAAETAELLSQSFKNVELKTRDELASGTRAQTIWDLVVKFKDLNKLLLVGHMPDLSIFAARVVPDPALLEDGLVPGEVWAIETGPVEQGWAKGTFLWRKQLSDW